MVLAQACFGVSEVTDKIDVLERDGTLELEAIAPADDVNVDDRRFLLFDEEGDTPLDR